MLTQRSCATILGVLRTNEEVRKAAQQSKSTQMGSVSSSLQNRG